MAFTEPISNGKWTQFFCANLNFQYFETYVLTVKYHIKLDLMLSEAHLHCNPLHGTYFCSLKTCICPSAAFYLVVQIKMFIYLNFNLLSDKIPKTKCLLLFNAKGDWISEISRLSISFTYLQGHLHNITPEVLWAGISRTKWHRETVRSDTVIVLRYFVRKYILRLCEGAISSIHLSFVISDLSDRCSYNPCALVWIEVICAPGSVFLWNLIWWLNFG